jgi:hypothetical protein
MLVLATLLVVFSGVFFRNFYKRNREYREFKLLQLRYDSFKEYLSQRSDALILLDQYQRALEQASSSDSLEGTIDWDLLLTHLRKAKLFRLMGDEDKYTVESKLEGQIIQSNPSMVEMFRTMSPEDYLTVMDSKELESASIAGAASGSGGHP